MFRIRSGVELVDGEDGKFLFDVGKGVYWHLNESAVELITGLTEGRSMDDIVAATAEAAHVEADRVRTDYTALLRELRRSKLVEGDAR